MSVETAASPWGRGCPSQPQVRQTVGNMPTVHGLPEGKDASLIPIRFHQFDTALSFLGTAVLPAAAVPGTAGERSDSSLPQTVATAASISSVGRPTCSQLSSREMNESTSAAGQM